ncbi:hypothetical protein [Octadecabacter ascidiaceicola]|uniref:G domain-containing protein n=1 Tax=Octadecabacter ascidiaceicola TaxID=1655543 RepID=A0A238KCG7_9RHOB|nr:hypothetical protein [Octadecabacter ascidiaceicola]SMX40217.1 hypothetical protein OCA8868_02320 [Octadecabacter ascidiaceicola]
MAIEWVLPVAKEAYKHREKAFTGFDTLMSKVFGTKHRIAFVGPGGIGKSVLLDHLNGKASKPNYKAPAMSKKEEFGGAKSNGNRLGVIVAPGQGGPKLDSYENIFGEKTAVDGIVFVAASGLVSLRDERAMRLMIEKGINTTEKWRDLNRQTELEELSQICTLLRTLKMKARKPKWLLVAATKIDLDYHNIELVKDYYSPSGSGPFPTRLNELLAQLGSDNFEWDSVPVCSQLDDFEWGGQRISPNLNEAQRDHYLAQMLQKMGELCR